MHTSYTRLFKASMSPPAPEPPLPPFPSVLMDFQPMPEQQLSHFSGRWFLRQGWLLVVPPTGEPRPRMFFLFSDVLLMAKPRPPLHLLKSGTFVCRALYPMAQCQLCRVFGHSGGPCGGLLSVSNVNSRPKYTSNTVDQLISLAQVFS